jgi:sulfoxide reductase heme-binding subunit YedZ
MSILAAGPSPFWYLTRGAGAVAMLLLTASVVLGIVDFSRWSTDKWPRFVTDALHRNVSMLAIAMVVIHVITTVADGFAPIGLQDAIIPFLSPYRPLWLGLGAISFDLLLAVALTSMLRSRIGYRTWRAVHWAAYACWPLAMVHGLGTGSDTAATWMLLLSAACLVAVLVALGWRVATAPPESAGRRLAAGGLAVAPIALVVWAASGPLAGNWAARAGTPTNILQSFGSAPSGSATTQGTGLDAPFTAQLKGSVRQQPSPGSGLASVDLNMAMSGGGQGTLDVTITGQPLAGGGVAMTQGTVSLGPRGTPNLYTGHIIGLHGSRIDASASSSDGAALGLSIDLSIDQASGTVSGTVSAQAASNG